MSSDERCIFVVGLTGGIGSGKTTVANIFAALGVPIVDADLIARELVARGQPALREIRDRFGDNIIGADGSLDRATLRERVFAHPSERAALEAILHPRIRSAMTERFALLRAPYCIACIPLLIETGQSDMVDRVLVVDLPPPLQMRRVQARDQLATDEVRAIIASQCTREQRLAAADDVLKNDADLASLKPEIERLHQAYLQIALEHRCQINTSVGQ